MNLTRLTMFKASAHTFKTIACTTDNLMLKQQRGGRDNDPDRQARVEIRVEKVVMVAAQQVIYILTWQPRGNKWVLLPRLQKDA